MRLSGIIILLFQVSALSLFSQNRTLRFSEPDINDRNEIILQIENPSSAGMNYTTLVRGRADAGNPEALTVYPEKAFFSSVGNEISIYNHFGCYSFDTENRIWSVNRFIPTVSDNQPVSPLSLRPLEFSPDGRFALFVREDEDFSSLMLYDRDKSQSVLVTDRLRKEYVHTLALWSPDSRYFIYRRGRDLYYFSMDQYQSGRIPAESFRNTGFRDIQSIQWEQGNYLYVLKDRLVYRIHSSEFFTRSFYSDPFRKGVVWGKIPISYDPAFDRFSIDRRGQNIFLLKNGREGMVFPLQSPPESISIQQTPILNSSETREIADFRWLNDGTLLALIRDKINDSSVVAAYRAGPGSGFIPIASGVIEGISVDPVTGNFALLKTESVDLYGSKSLTLEKSVGVNHTLYFFWGRNEYIALGEKLITTVSRETGQIRTVGLSQVEQSGFSPAGNLLAFSEGRWYEYKESLNWQLSDHSEVRPSRLGTAEYRIFLEDLRGPWYGSSLKIRNVDGFDTRDFIPLYHHNEAMPVPLQLTADSRTNPWYFDHGNRDENKEVSLVFNGVDTSEGVSDILKILNHYQIHGSFFLNGDFIHANPVETSLIASSGSTVGSLFYTWFDMSDPDYQIDQAFLKKGLARNEDDYFIATGREMAMLWHTPYYFINSEILETSESMEYIYVGTDLKIRDRNVFRPGSPGEMKEVLSLADDLLVKVGPGSVIPLTLGKVPGQDEYLFLLLPMIIEDLLSRGYTFVPLTDMIRNSR